jgi:DNA (cytosine-5)-methyltransferase 1
MIDRKITIGSTFSGIGGLELGLEAALDAVTLWQCEQNEFCRSVLAKHWPDAVRYGDIRTFNGAFAAPVDVLCGGFPCQDISSANPNGLGLLGSKSSLWFDMLRVIREQAPRIVVIENSPRLRSKGLSEVIKGLADAGYNAAWEVFSAAEAGAPHIRERLFVVAWINDPGARRINDRRTLPAHADRASSARAEFTRRVHAAYADPNGLLDWCGWKPRSAVRGMDARLSAGMDGRRRLKHSRMPHDRDRQRALGNAVSPFVSFRVGMWIRALGLV